MTKQESNIIQFITNNINKFDTLDITSITHTNEVSTCYDITVENDNTFFCKLDSGDTVLMKNCDGNHIMALVINMFHKFWPEVITDGMLYRLKTPVIRVFDKKENEVAEFFSENEYDKWVKDNPGIMNKYNKSYYKGLGTFDSKDFEKYVTNPKYLVRIDMTTEEDSDIVDMLFSNSRADDRKVWLNIAVESDDIEDTEEVEEVNQ